MFRLRRFNHFCAPSLSYSPVVKILDSRSCISDGEICPSSPLSISSPSMCPLKSAIRNDSMATWQEDAREGRGLPGLKRGGSKGHNVTNLNCYLESTSRFLSTSPYLSLSLCLSLPLSLSISLSLSLFLCLSLSLSLSLTCFSFLEDDDGPLLQVRSLFHLRRHHLPAHWPPSA